MTTLLLGQDTFHWGYETHHKNQDHFPQSFHLTRWPPTVDAIPRLETAEQREEDHDNVPDTGPSTDSSAADTSGTSESSPGSSSTTGTDETTDTAYSETSGSSSSSDGSTESDSAPSTPPSPRQTSTPCTEEAMPAKVPSGPPSPSLADSSLEVRANPKRPSRTCPHTFPIPEADKCSKAKGNCTQASSTARYQPVAIARARRAPSRTIRGIQWCQSLCSKQAERQYSNIQWWRGATTTQKKEAPKDQKDSETVKLGPFRRKRGRNTHTNCKKPNSVLKWLELPPSWETARKQHISGPLRTIQDTSTGIPV